MKRLLKVLALAMLAASLGFGQTHSGGGGGGSGQAKCTGTTLELLGLSGTDCVGIPNSSFDPVTGDVTLGAYVSFNGADTILWTNSGFGVETINADGLTFDAIGFDLGSTGAGPMLFDANGIIEFGGLGTAGILFDATGDDFGGGGTGPIALTSAGTIVFDDSDLSGGGSKLDLDSTTPGVITASTPVSVPNQSQMAGSAYAANALYVDTAVANAVAGVNPAVAVLVATTSASDTSGLTYANGVSGVGATFTGAVNTAITIDGVTFTAVGQRLLVKNDTQSPSGAFNGIYSLTALQTAGTGAVFTRATDYDTPSNMNSTGAIPVQSGTANTTTSWLMTAQIVTVGTTPLTFAQFSYAPSAIATLAGNNAFTGANTVGNGASLAAPGGTLLGGNVGPSSNYTLYPATSSTCLAYSATGTTYCAVNNATGSIDYNSTDISVLAKDVITANSATCGLITLKNGKYSAATLNGSGPYSVFQIPNQTATNQGCWWTIQGEESTFWAGESATPIQTGGAIIDITPTAVGTVSSTAIISCVYALPESGGIGAEVRILDTHCRFPTNQTRGYEIAYDLYNAGQVDVERNLADFNLQYSSMATNAPSGALPLIGFTSTYSGQGNIERFDSNFSVGFNIGYDWASEHVVSTNDTAIYDYWPAVFAHHPSPGIYHPINVTNFTDQENPNGFWFDQYMVAGTLVNIESLDIEIDTGAKWYSRSTAAMYESNNCHTSGVISYTVNTTGGSIVAGTPLFASGGGCFITYNSQSQTWTFPKTVNTASTGVWNLSAATGTEAFKVPSNTSNTATAAGVVDYDLTADNLHTYDVDTSADAIVPKMVYNTASSGQVGNLSAVTMISSTGVAHDYLLNWTVSLSVAGTSCTGSTTVVLNAIFEDPQASGYTTQALGTLTIASLGVGTIGFVASGSENILAKAGTYVKYSTSGYALGTACSGTNPTYIVTPTLVQLW